MKPYVDGYVLPIAQKDLDSYQKMANDAGKMWIEHGALAYFECAAEDMKPAIGEMPPEMAGMKMRTFAELADAGADDTVIFAFIIYRDRAHRDEVNKKVMEDPRMSDPEYNHEKMPFDMQRMAYGGFEAIVHYEKGGE